MEFVRKEFSFKKYWGFFAFWNSQFDEGANGRPHSDFVSCGGGLFAPKDTVHKMLLDLDNWTESENKRRIAEVGIEWIIRYELANYECYYTGDPEDAIEALADYGITKKQVLDIFYEHSSK